MFSTTAERTEIRNKLTVLLKSVPIGGTVTHEQILAATGLPMEHTRPILYSIQAALNKSSGLTFTNVHGVGYQLLATSGLSEIGKAARRSITKKSRRAQKTIVNAVGRANDVDPATRARLHTEIGVLGLIELAAGEKSFKRIQKDVPDEIVSQRAPTANEISASMISALSLK